MAENVSFAEPKKTFKLRKGPVKKCSTASPSLNTSLPVSSTFSNTSTPPPTQQSNSGVKRRNPFSTVDNVNDDKRQRLSDINVQFNSPGELSKQRFISETASPLTGSRSQGAVQNNASSHLQGLFYVTLFPDSLFQIKIPICFYAWHLMR